ncbi:MAG: hypothetical protein DWQ07_06665 [Chloroflexi bacterium]|nr:MAG: hypothetical protein DWQ07_06665 [Chloroflexota bacterium]MBL1195887.1 hypothetical protein [Chloroflexota bacterium]
MKDLFPSYYRPTDDDFKEMWENGTFIFDTNVLLNLYRYKQETRDQLFTVLEALQNRIWIPFHVALEFQNNRLKVIADQRNKYREVSALLENSVKELNRKFDDLRLRKRHSIINPDDLTKEINKAYEEAVKDVNSIGENEPKDLSEDELRQKIDTLFSGRVGPPPNSQEEILEWTEGAKHRYELGIPPGYEDDDKRTVLLYNGLEIESKGGDFIIWKQLLDFLQTKPDIQSVVFVTDDGKEDWWLKIQGKTIGPRPELIDEAIAFGKVQHFHMYEPEQFLEFAGRFLKIKISADALEDVRDVSSIDASETDRAEIAYYAVEHWITTRFVGFELITDIFQRPDIVAVDIHDDVRYGFETKLLKSSRNIRKHIQLAMLEAEHYMDNRKAIDKELYEEYWLIYPFFSREETTEIGQMLSVAKFDQPSNIKIIIGTISTVGKGASLHGEFEASFII